MQSVRLDAVSGFAPRHPRKRERRRYTCVLEQLIGLLVEKEVGQRDFTLSVEHDMEQRFLHLGISALLLPFGSRIEGDRNVFAQDPANRGSCNTDSKLSPGPSTKIGLRESRVLSLVCL
uniref:Uncharacterized protein n=1 Tax=Peronospora matthiolae TaxID=2874970 RepID=A0AAV1TQ18_9STRA